MRNKNRSVSSKTCKDIRLQFLQQIVKKRKNFKEALELLSDLYTKASEYKKSLVVDRHLAWLEPFEPGYYYNIACDYALLGENDRAFTFLKISVLLGYRKFNFLSKDPDLANLRRDKRYENFVKKIKALSRGI